MKVWAVRSVALLVLIGGVVVAVMWAGGDFAPEPERPAGVYFLEPMPDDLPLGITFAAGGFAPSGMLKVGGWIDQGVCDFTKVHGAVAFDCRPERSTEVIER